MKKIRWDILLIGAGIICLTAFGAISIKNYTLEKTAENVKAQLKQMTVYAEANKSEQTDGYSSPYEKIFELNSDMAAWLFIPDTDIDYPVMQTVDEPQYYLYRDFFGNDDKNGTLFIDASCGLDDERQNLIIHGHHMKSGAMFGTLGNYTDKEYGLEHSKIYLYTKDSENVYELISVFETKLYDDDSENFRYYDYKSFNDKESFDEYYKNIKELSLYDTQVEAKYGDEFITLSTCSYHTKDGRLAVIAKKI